MNQKNPALKTIMLIFALIFFAPLLSAQQGIIANFATYEIVEGDTPPVVTCGDSVCGSAETCSTCSADCGACPVSPPANPGGGGGGGSGGGGGGGGGGSGNPEKSQLLKVTPSEAGVGATIKISALCKWIFGCTIVVDGNDFAQIQNSSGFKDFTKKLTEPGRHIFRLYQNGTVRTLVAEKKVMISSLAAQPNAGSPATPPQNNTGAIQTPPSNSEQGGAPQNDGNTQTVTIAPPQNAPIDNFAISLGLFALAGIMAVAFYFTRQKKVL